MERKLDKPPAHGKSAALMKLNPWQRAWLVTSALWVIFWIALGFSAAYQGNLSSEDALWFFTAAVLPPQIFYASGLAVAWVIRRIR